MPGSLDITSISFTKSNTQTFFTRQTESGKYKMPEDNVSYHIPVNLNFN